MMSFRGNRVTPREKCALAFTLVELLVVIAIIVILLVALVPGVNSLSRSNGRKAAVSALLGVVEQTRMQAIKDGQATYLVFPDQLPAGADSAAIEKYPYRSYAIFEDDAANPGNQKQLTPWRALPTGVSIRQGSVDYLANTIPFAFTPVGSTSTGKFPFLKFNANGEIDPSTTRDPTNTTGTLQFGIFEGHVDSKGEHFTGRSQAVESIAVTRLTGRAERM